MTRRLSVDMTGDTLTLRERRPRGLALQLFLFAVFLVPLQLDVGAFKAVVDSRLPPGDFVLMIVVLLAPATFAIRRTPVLVLPLAMIAVLAYGVIVAIVMTGSVTNHSLFVKFVGAMVLATWCLVAATFVRQGHGPAIIRAWLIGMALWGVVAYIDWSVADVVPFMAQRETRFGGPMVDPNNAGAAYGIATVLAWRYGHRVFSSRATYTIMLVTLGTLLALTLSRGAFVSLAVAVVVVLTFSRVGVARWGRYLVASAIVVGYLTASGFVSDAQEDFERRPDNVSGRVGFVDEGVDLLVESRGLGAGLGAVRSDSDVEQIIHNTAIWLVVEMSVPGLVFFVMMAAVPFHAALGRRADDKDLAIALIGAHVLMLVASVGIEAVYQRYWWLVIALCVPPVVATRPQAAYSAPAPHDLAL